MWRRQDFLRPKWVQSAGVVLLFLQAGAYVLVRQNPHPLIVSAGLGLVAVSWYQQSSREFRMAAEKYKRETGDPSP